jgi:hypothetical protein
MVFVLKRTPAFQLFGPFQDRSQALDWVKQHANERRYACCILEPLDPPEGEVKGGAQRLHLKHRLTLPPDSQPKTEDLSRA